MEFERNFIEHYKFYNKVVVDSTYKFPFELGPTDEFTELFDGKIEKFPMGPRAISLDFELPYNGQFVGIPERTSNKGTILLDDTVKFGPNGEKEVLGNPYRLFNLDVSEYQANETYLGLYGCIPLLVSLP
jgi:hypothetical protein